MNGPAGTPAPREGAGGSAASGPPPEPSGAAPEIGATPDAGRAAIAWYQRCTAG